MDLGNKYKSLDRAGRILFLSKKIDSLFERFAKAPLHNKFRKGYIKAIDQYRYQLKQLGGGDKDHKDHK